MIDPCDYSIRSHHFRLGVVLTQTESHVIADVYRGWMNGTRIVG